MTEQCYPFRHVYTGIEKTMKRAIPLEAVKRIKNLDLQLIPGLEFARDMFIFSFYTRGMSFIDMAYLKKKDLSNGVLTYLRRKTGQLLSIRWEKCMQEIVNRYDTKGTCYLLPIIRKPGENERGQYQNTMFLVNRKLKAIGKMANLQLPLTMYLSHFVIIDPILTSDTVQNFMGGIEKSVSVAVMARLDPLVLSTLHKVSAIF